MKLISGLRQPGVIAALTAALLFGMGTPLAKQLLTDVSPWLLAGLLYLGSGLGLFVYRYIKHAPKVTLSRHELPWFMGAVLFGGVIGPVLLMLGLTRVPATSASLLLNAEGVFTALLAWFVFKENLDHRIALGMAAMVVGAMVLSWSNEVRIEGIWPSLAILGACLAWGLDNNLTRKVSLNDATWIAATKGGVAGAVNLLLAFALGAHLPRWSNVLGAMTVGLLAYGISLVLFVIGLRHLGTARTGAYFSIAPFIGAVIALMMGEALTLQLVIAAALMAIGIALHLTENHEHEHVHEVLAHEHEHTHDEHHQHEHDEPIASGIKHSHWHEHLPVRHKHGHFPDMHHQHTH
jgi:drug/metabolite transporter (DMT)-like permease